MNGRVHEPVLECLSGKTFERPVTIGFLKSCRVLIACLSQIGGASEGWTLAFAIIGGIVTAGTAWVRIASLAGPVGEDDVQHADAIQASPFANDR